MAIRQLATKKIGATTTTTATTAPQRRRNNETTTTTTTVYQYQKHVYEITLMNEITGQRRVYRTEASIGAEKPLLTVISDFLNSDNARTLLNGFDIRSIAVTNGRATRQVGSKLISDVTSHYRRKHINSNVVENSLSLTAETSGILRLCKS
jgi:hypothetical protein